MKFTIERERFLEPLNQVIGVVAKRQTLPVLSNLLIVANKQTGLTLTGTDLEVEMIARLETDVAEEGEVTVPAHKLVDICRALPEGASVTLSSGDQKVSLSAGRSRFTLATLPATDFPQIEDVATQETVEISQEGLARLIKETAFAMAQQDVRYYLNGLLLELGSDKVRTVATDGHRLAVAEMESKVNVKETRQVIIPRKGIQELQRLLDEGDEPVSLELGANHLRLRHGAVTFTSKLIDGRFPDYQAVIPEKMDKSVELSRGRFREALHRAAILSSEKVRGVKLDLSPNALVVVAHNQEQEEAVEELEVGYEGDSLAVGFNVQYLLDALNALRGEDITLYLKDGNSSCVLRDKSKESSRHVVMPLRL